MTSIPYFFAQDAYAQEENLEIELLIFSVSLNCLVPLLNKLWHFFISRSAVCIRLYAFEQHLDHHSLRKQSPLNIIWNLSYDEFQSNISSVGFCSVPVNFSMTFSSSLITCSGYFQISCVSFISISLNILLWRVKLLFFYVEVVCRRCNLRNSSFYNWCVMFKTSALFCRCPPNDAD